MLETLKNFGGKKLGGLILIIVIIIAFGFGGFGGGFSTNNQNNIAKINKTNVTTQDFMDYVNQSGISLDAIRTNLDNNIIEELLSGLISTTLIDLEVKDFALSISERTILKTIKDNKNFQDENGIFQRVKYEKFLLSSNLSAPMFELKLKNRELQKHLFDIIGAGTITPNFLIEEKYEERFALRLSKLNVLSASIAVILFLVSITASIIFFTPIKEYIPGYDTTEMRVQAVENIRLLDSVMIILEDYQQYALALQATISGEEYTNKYQSDTELIKVDLSELNRPVNIQDSVLRRLVEREDRFNVIETSSLEIGLNLQPPVNGIISQEFSVPEKHYGVDIVLKENFISRHIDAQLHYEEAKSYQWQDRFRAKWNPYGFFEINHNDEYWQAFVAHWDLGGACAAVLSTHSPASCLPLTGLTQITPPVGQDPILLPLKVGNREILFEAYEFSKYQSKLFVFRCFWPHKLQPYEPNLFPSGGYNFEGRIQSAIEGRRNVGGTMIALALANVSSSQIAVSKFQSLAKIRLELKDP